MVVPLDGSPLAEMALHHVEQLAARLSLEVVLIRVVETPAWTYDGERLHPSVASFMEERLEFRAEEYLETVAGGLRAGGIPTRSSVIAGSPAQAIIAYTRSSEAAMVAIATHGRSGLGRLLTRSVTDAVIRSLDAPVLIVPPGRAAWQGVGAVATPTERVPETSTPSG